ncbi:hypothetical protein UCRPA7_2295 [Phaeoacremonium minimum UCRPA7]|uniref:Uncharacterized protein n=1 Tax=Phaeoacremonium minimum (strain UCR-PA7) TaxID=1286976 RepID=R8BS95_PHAM7|nr:hypothetical protein UCRPA7_2295 [Phaeoacremonium minimum UCRPA7]EOO02211.1 hypothetical protein UCRPA7_2295 [Phaeoacremonium minimum UCRPA7]
MAPLIPRMHLFEIDDQPWFHPWFRARVQAALTQAWTFRVPVLQRMSAASMAAQVLCLKLASSVTDYVFIDFCAGGGGPTPFIEASLNAQLASLSKSADVDAVRFVLTDLHPHVEDWAKAAAASPNISYEPSPVDAANAPPDLLRKHSTGPGRSPADRDRKKKVFRLFNLAFHHFDDALARAILRNTLETSSGFAIFELPDRTAAGFLTTLVFGVGIMLTAPYYAWAWRSPMTLFWAWVVPVLPFVLVFDGIVSGLRVRTPEEVEVLLRTCGAEGGAEGWEVRSGRERHLWPCGYLNWIICVKKESK